jgi:hypothetical protein
MVHLLYQFNPVPQLTWMLEYQTTWYGGNHPSTCPSRLFYDMYIFNVSEWIFLCVRSRNTKNYGLLHMGKSKSGCFGVILRLFVSYF